MQSVARVKIVQLAVIRYGLRGVRNYADADDLVLPKSLFQHIESSPEQSREILHVSPTVVFKTRSSADADNRLDAFSGQSRSTNMVPFHM